jgi:FkbM family methyltransferase
MLGPDLRKRSGENLSAKRRKHLKIVDGWQCPDLLSGPGKYMRRAREDAPVAIESCREKRIAIQAGGHIGTWPVFLSTHFQTVFTFEPTPDNWLCLTQNVATFVQGPERVFPFRAALSESGGPLEMHISGKSTGQHVATVSDHAWNVGGVPSIRIDDLALPFCDAIFLDLEGFENFALRGARETIARCRPVLMVENNKRALRQGFKMNDVPELLRSWGYQLKASIHEDFVFTPTGKSK